MTPANARSGLLDLESNVLVISQAIVSSTGLLDISFSFYVLSFQMGILLAGANFDLFLDKVDSGQRLADAGDTENPLYRFVRNKFD